MTITGAYSAAMARLTAARGAEAAYDALTWTPAYHVAEQGGPRIPDDVDAEMNRLTDIRCEAEDAVISTPAPDIAAVVWKIDYARPRLADFCDWPDDWWNGVMADLRRLAGRTNDPAAFAAAMDAYRLAFNGANAFYLLNFPGLDGDLDTFEPAFDKYVFAARDAAVAVLATPAASAADMLDKLAVIEQHGAAGWHEDEIAAYTRQLIEDARFLAGASK